jgi:hypothetical protein
MDHELCRIQKAELAAYNLVHNGDEARLYLT